jgi:hypothetical protein
VHPQFRDPSRHSGSAPSNSFAFSLNARVALGLEIPAQLLVIGAQRLELAQPQVCGDELGAQLFDGFAFTLQISGELVTSGRQLGQVAGDGVVLAHATRLIALGIKAK